MPAYRFTVFTKPWKTPLPDLAAHIKAVGFDGVELAVRPGYSVNEENAETELSRAVSVFADAGLTINSIAASATPDVIRACQMAGVPLVRVLHNLKAGETYQNGAARLKNEWETLVPLLQETGVCIGIQNHSGRFVPVHAFGMAELLADFDPRHVCAVWDAAHNALEGEGLALALDLICGPKLGMVNLKNGFREQTGVGDKNEAQWKTRWVGGRDGLADWFHVAAELGRRDWGGVVCLSAQYSDAENTDRLIAADLAFAKECFGGG